MKTVNVLALFGLVLILVGCSKEEMPAVQETLNLSATAITGNEAPSGEHYNLNIIGTSDKLGDMDGANGHVIFVPLVPDRKTKIELEQGTDFAVLDANGTDDDGAIFQLPSPGIVPYVVGDEGDADTETDYSVFVRPLGKPGGWSTITTAADVVETNLTTFLTAKEAKVLNKAAELGGFASVEQVGSPITFREKGKTTFTNVTAELLTIVLKVEYTYDHDSDLSTPDLTETVYLRVPIFHDILANEYWEYDNNGLRILQVRFYPGVVSNVTERDYIEEWDKNF